MPAQADAGCCPRYGSCISGMHFLHMQCSSSCLLTGLKHAQAHPWEYPQWLATCHVHTRAFGLQQDAASQPAVLQDQSACRLAHVQGCNELSRA